MASLKELLLWARTNGFRLSEVSCEGVSITVDDLRPIQANQATPEPVTTHQKWAAALGIAGPPDDEDEEEAA